MNLSESGPNYLEMLRRIDLPITEKRFFQSPPTASMIPPSGTQGGLTGFPLD